MCEAVYVSACAAKKTVWRKQSGAGHRTAVEFHTEEVGDMTCEWIEWEPSCHSSGNIILSLASPCLFCACLALPCQCNVSSVCLSLPAQGQQAKSSLVSRWRVEYARPLRRTKAWLVYPISDRMALVTHVSAPLAWTVIMCQPFIALPNNLEYFDPLPSPLPSKPTVVRKCLSDNK